MQFKKGNLTGEIQQVRIEKFSRSKKQYVWTTAKALICDTSGSWLMSDTWHGNASVKIQVQLFADGWERVE